LLEALDQLPHEPVGVVRFQRFVEIEPVCPCFAVTLVDVGRDVEHREVPLDVLVTL
jgi:hypothetical protein